MSASAALRGEMLSVNGTRLFTETAGRGPPLLMIPGLGAGNWLWQRATGPLSRHFRLVMPELRGSGRSEKPDERYTIAGFAKDVIAIADHLEIERFHLLGVSMGGFVAQRIAAGWPDRVDRLVLVATAPGGQRQVGPTGDVLTRTIRPRGRTRRERLEDAYQLAFTDEFRASHPDLLERITAWRMEHAQPEFAYYRQLLAGNAYDAAADDARIRAPTLICGGAEDAVVPPENAERLAEAIDDATVVTFAGRHMFFLEHPRQFVRAVIEFLAVDSSSERGR